MRILVVIDNVFQYEKLKQLFAEKKPADMSVDFRHSSVRSAIWDHPDFQGGRGLVDVRKDCDWIVSTYKLVISVHCFQFFPAALVKGVRCINVHPGYNPINRGWYPQVFAIVHDLPIGATIHEMDEKLDHGPIIARKLVDQHTWDTSYTIYNRVLEAEIELFEQHFDAILMGTYAPVVPESEGNMFSKQDFTKLCALNMEEQGRFRDFYNRLRALTHGTYKNAWFIDPVSGKKIYVSIDIREE